MLEAGGLDQILRWCFGQARMEGTQHQSPEDARPERLVLAIGLEQAEAAVLTYDAATRGLRVALFACVQLALPVVEAEPLLAVVGGPSAGDISGHRYVQRTSRAIRKSSRARPCGAS